MTTKYSSRIVDRQLQFWSVPEHSLLEFEVEFGKYHLKTFLNVMDDKIIAKFSSADTPREYQSVFDLIAELISNYPRANLGNLNWREIDYFMRDRNLESSVAASFEIDFVEIWMAAFKRQFETLQIRAIRERKKTGEGKVSWEKLSLPNKVRKIEQIISTYFSGQTKEADVKIQLVLIKENSVYFSIHGVGDRIHLQALLERRLKTDFDNNSLLCIIVE
jgi:hypothetical protein